MPIAHPSLIYFCVTLFFDFIVILTKLSFRSNPNILLTSLCVRYPNIWLARELHVCGWRMRSVSMQQVFLYHLDQRAQPNGWPAELRIHSKFKHSHRKSVSNNRFTYRRSGRMLGRASDTYTNAGRLRE